MKKQRVKSNLEGRDPLDYIYSRVCAVGHKWLCTKFKIQVFFVLSVLLIKNGLGFEIYNVKHSYLPASLQLPDPYGYFSASLGNLILARMVGVDSVYEWIVLHSFLVVLVYLIAIYLIFRSSLSSSSILLLIFASSGAFVSLIQTIGKYDVLIILGACIFVLAKKNLNSLAGVSLMVLGNPEQALLATLCLAIITFLPSFEFWRTRATIGILVTVIAWISIQLWMYVNEVESRLAVLDYFLGLSLANFLRGGLNAMWSWLGVGWLVVLMLLYLFSGRERAVIFVSLVGLPAIVTMITADGARVFGTVVLPSFIVCSIWIWNKFSTNYSAFKFAIGGYIILWVMLPSSSNGWSTVGNYVATIVQSSISRFTQGV